MTQKTSNILLLLIMLSVSILSNNMQFAHFSINEGLPYSHVTSINQDAKGYIWIGTRKGLYRYDGYNINPVKTIESVSNLFDNTQVTDILASSKGDVWISMNNVVFKYIPESDVLRAYPLEDKTAVKFAESSDGRLFCLSNLNLFVFNETKNQFEKFGLNLNQNSNQPLFQITADTKNRLWIISSTTLYRIDLKSGTITQLDINLNQLKLKQALDLMVDSEENLWIATSGNGLLLYDIKIDKFQQIKFTSGCNITIVRTLCEDDNKQLWVGGENGICILNIKTKEVLQTIKQDYNNVLGLNDNAVYSIFQDREHNLWIGTYFGGINILYRDHQQFNYYAPGYTSKNISGKAIRQIIEDGSFLWIATEDGGLDKFNNITKEFIHIKSQPGKRSITNNNIHSLLKDKNNNLWIGSFAGGLNVLNLKTNQFRYYNTENTPELKSNMIFCLLEDADGTIYIGTPSGLILYSPATKNFFNLNHPILNSCFVFNILQDSEKNIWIATTKDGLFCYNKTNKSIKQYLTFDKIKMLNENRITKVYEDSFKRIWIGTDVGGLYLFNKQNDTFKHFDVPGKCVSGLVEDNHKRLWISTEKGLLCYDLKKNKMDVYSKEDGLPCDQFNYNSAFKTSSGELFFGTINGLISFNPEKIGQTKYLPNIVFVKLYIAGEEVTANSPNSPLKTSLEESSEIILSYQQATSFAIEYAAIFYGHTKSISYAVMMEGLDKEWNMLKDQRRVNYSKLPPGKYTFKVKVLSADKNWSDSHVRKISIRVLPPFYLSVWAWIIYILLISAITYSILRVIRIRNIEKNQIQQEKIERNKAQEINKTKIDFFTNISHELKTPLTLIVSPLQRLIEEKSYPEALKETMDVILRNAQRMSRIVDELMTFSKIEIGKERLNLHKGNVLEFISSLADTFTLLAKEKNINFRSVVENNGEDVWFSIANIEKIVYNLLSNSFKFTSANGSVSIHARLMEGEHEKIYLEIKVTDTGVGINKENLERIFENYFQADPHSNIRGSGIGLSLTKRLVNLHKGTIQVESDTDKGSTFMVRIDVSDSSYSGDEKTHEILDKDFFKNYNFITIEKDIVEKTNSLLKNAHEPVRTLLLVDDNEELRKFLCDIFKDKYRVFSAENGKIALEIARKEYPDLIISDVMMPEMDGFELCKIVKDSFSTCHIPVILLTAKTGTDDYVEGYDMGADFYIEKPFNAQLLEMQVQNILKTKQNNIQIIKNDPQKEISEVTTNERDSIFVKKLNDLIEKNMDNQFFSISDITKSLNVSRTLLHVKCKNLIDTSVTDYIREIRMNKAKVLLKSGENISETAYAVGYSDPGYFSKVFKKQFNITPSDYLKSM